MKPEEHRKNLMRYMDGEMSARERADFERHIEYCDTCSELLRDFSALKEVTDTMKIADLPEAVWEKYWNSVYNRIERSVAWFLFIVGALILNGYWIYRAVTEPELDNIVRLGLVFLTVGLAVLFLSVLREKRAVNKKDRYISEVER